MGAWDDDVAACYESLRATLAGHPGELPPFAERNVLKALAALWQVMNGLDREPDHLYELGA